MNKQIKIKYTNYKNETNDRNIEPIEVWFGSNKWHTEKQWFLKAVDLDKGEQRDFALIGISHITNHVEHKVDNKITVDSSLEKVKLFTDGGSRGNPGPSAMGYVILDENDGEIIKDYKYLGITTNNQAEYQGLQEGLKTCFSMGFKEIDVYMDSLLVVNQMKGIFKVKNRDLWPIHDAIKEFSKNFKKVTYSHVPRELNKIADMMVNECLDSQHD